MALKEQKLQFKSQEPTIKQVISGKIRLILKNINNKLSDIRGFYILKKLDTLGAAEFSFKNRILNIKSSDILLVEDANILSQSVIEALKNRVFVIVQRHFEMQKDKAGWFSKIIEYYKMEKTFK